jgi:hypothetical protein
LKDKSVSDLLNFIISKLKTLQKKGSIEDVQTLSEVIEVTEQLNIVFKGFRKVLLIAFSSIGLLLIILILSTLYTVKLENINRELEYQKTDSILQTIMDIKEINDTTTNTLYRYRKRGDKIITYQDLINETDSLSHEMDSLRFNIFTMTQKLKMVKDTYGIKFREYYKAENNDSANYITIESNKIDSAFSKIDYTFQNLINEKNKISNTSDSLRAMNSVMNQKLKMAKNIYEVDFVEYFKVENSDTINFIRVEGNKIDSAFRLLSIYRDSLYFDKEKEAWYIK